MIDTMYEIIESCPRDKQSRCDHMDADRCCGGGYQTSCDCSACHEGPRPTLGGMLEEALAAVNAPITDIVGGDRCGITANNGLNEGDDPNGWWVAYSPRNGSRATAEGCWKDWVTLARKIIAQDESRKTVLK